MGMHLLIQKLKDLPFSLYKVCDVDYSQIETSIDFGEALRANYEWFQSPEGALTLPLTSHDV